MRTSETRAGLIAPNRVALGLRGDLVSNLGMAAIRGLGRRCHS